MTYHAINKNLDILVTRLPIEIAVGFGFYPIPAQRRSWIKAYFELLGPFKFAHAYHEHKFGEGRMPLYPGYYSRVGSEVYDLIYPLKENIARTIKELYDFQLPLGWNISKYNNISKYKGLPQYEFREVLKRYMTWGQFGNPTTKFKELILKN